MTPETEKRLAEILKLCNDEKEVSLSAIVDYIEDYRDSCIYLLSIIDELRAEKEKLRNHPAIITYPEEEKE